MSRALVFPGIIWFAVVVFMVTFTTDLDYSWVEAVRALFYISVLACGYCLVLSLFRPKQDHVVTRMRWYVTRYVGSQLLLIALEAGAYLLLKKYNVKPTLSTAVYVVLPVIYFALISRFFMNFLAAGKEYEELQKVTWAKRPLGRDANTTDRRAGLKQGAKTKLRSRGIPHGPAAFCF